MRLTGVGTARLIALACVAALATACAEPAPDTARTGPAGTAAAASAPRQVPEEPPMTEDPPMRRMPGSEDGLVRCDAEAARGAVGQVATDAVVEQARLAAGADVARTLSPGQMVTMEFHNSRLNLSVDEANVVVDVSCG